MGCCQSNTVVPTSGNQQNSTNEKATVTPRHELSRENSNVDRSTKGVNKSTSPRSADRSGPSTRFDDEERNEIVRWKTTVDSLLENTHLRNYALSKSAKQLGSLAGLKGFLQRSPASNQLEQVWIVYCWVTQNISYDGYGYRTGQRGQQNAEAVFSSGMAVCEGYASLMLECCNDLGITCRKVSGYAKGFGFTQGGTFNDTNHAWNAVQVDGDPQWRLVESTWGAGSMSDSYEANKSFTPYYFFVPPHVLVATHFCPDFQLQRRKLTLREFEQRSKLRILYHLSGLKCISHDVEEGVVDFTEQTATLVFEVPIDNDSNSLQARLETASRGGREIKNAVLVQKRGRQYELSLKLPEVRTVYDVVLFKTIENVDSSSLGHLQVTCVGSKTLSGEQNLFCQTYGESKKAYLVRPRDAVLSVSQCERFSVWLPDALEVVLIDEGNGFHHFQRSEGDEKPPNAGQQLWTLDHFFDLIGKHTLNVKYANGKSTYSSLFEYNVVASTANVNNTSTDNTSTALSTTPKLRCLSHNSKSVVSSQNPVVMTFQSARRVRLLVSLYDEKSEKVENAVLAQVSRLDNDDFRANISVILPLSEKVFKLQIFYNFGEGNSYKDSRNYSLQWTAKNQRDQRKYCNFSPPQYCEAYLFEPTLNELQLSRSHNFKIQIRGAIDVALVDSTKSWHHFSRDESSQNSDVWILEQFVPKTGGKCEIFAKFNLNESFYSVCGYTAV